MKSLVVPFKSGDETSVESALLPSQTTYTCPILLAPLSLVTQYSKNAAQPKSVLNDNIF